MKTKWKILLWSGDDRRYRIYDTQEEAMEAARVLRSQNLGYFLYEATGKSLRLIRAWEGARA